MLVWRRQLHLRHARVGTVVVLPQGEMFRVFRETTSDAAGPEPEVQLLVRFHLKGTDPGHRFRSWLFERESILNTVLYAGCEGFNTKLWLVDHVTADYAGLYTWAGRESARRYGEYISAVLRPLSTPGSVSFQLLEEESGPRPPAASEPSAEEERLDG
ncbi:MAG TPA: hypothetical protein VIY72_13055 [Acidimicrobiales bacterium]